MKAQLVSGRGWRKLLLAAAVMVTAVSGARAGWHWYDWPTKDVIFQGFGSVDQVRLGQWVAKTPNVTITFSEDDEAIQILVHVPRIELTAKEEQKRIDEDMRTLLTNIMPYWDGAYESICQLWQHYETDKMRLPIYFNQFEIIYTSTQKQRTVQLERRKDFNFSKRKSEVAARRTGQ